MDSDSEPLDQCPECGGMIQEGTVGGLCIACLLQGALRDNDNLEAEATEVHPAEGGDNLSK